MRCMRVQVSADYVGGLSLLPGGLYVATAAADGSASLLDWRRGGERVASVRASAPLRCCACDGGLMIAGSEQGQLLLWDLGQLTGQAPPDAAAGADGGGGGGAVSLAGADGLHPPLSGPSRAAVNGVSVGVLAGADGGGGDSSSSGACNVVAAMEDGQLVLWSSE